MLSPRRPLTATISLPPPLLPVNPIAPLLLSLSLLPLQNLRLLLERTLNRHLHTQTIVGRPRLSLPPRLHLSSLTLSSKVEPLLFATEVSLFPSKKGICLKADTLNVDTVLARDDMAGNWTRYISHFIAKLPETNTDVAEVTDVSSTTAPPKFSISVNKLFLTPRTASTTLPTISLPARLISLSEYPFTIPAITTLIQTLSNRAALSYGPRNYPREIRRAARRAAREAVQKRLDAVVERTYRGVKVVRKGVDDVRQVVSDLPDITEAPVLKSVSGGLSILESILGSREKGRDERGDMSNEAGVKGFRELDEGPAVAP